MHLQQTHRHKTSYINFREVGARLSGCDNNRNPDGGRRLSPTVVVIPIGHIGASVGHLGAICGDWLVLVLHRASTVEGSFRFLWQIVFLLVFLPLEQQHTGALYQLINTYRSTAMLPETAAYLLLHPVVFVDGVLILGWCYPKKWGHPFSEVIACWEIRRREKRTVKNMG